MMGKNITYIERNCSSGLIESSLLSNKGLMAGYVKRIGMLVLQLPRLSLKVAKQMLPYVPEVGRERE